MYICSHLSGPLAAKVQCTGNKGLASIRQVYDNHLINSAFIKKSFLIIEKMKLFTSVDKSACKDY